MNRGEFLKRAASIAVGASLAPFTSRIPAKAQTMADRPNILLIITDDQTYESLDQMAGTGIDPMAKTKAALSPGIRFNRCYAPSPLCAPSRVSMLTGTYSHNHGVKLNPNACENYRRKGLAKRSFPQYLKDLAGYDCGYFGKYVNQYENVGTWEPGAYRGWISTFHDRVPTKANVQGKVREPKQANGSHVQRWEEAGWLANKAIEFIESAREPWFTTLAFNNPHNPYTPSPTHEDKYSSTSMPSKPSYDHYDPGKPDYYNPKTGLNNQEKSQILTTWRGKMEETMDIDDAVGRICAAVDFEETYVFFITDNGYMLGEHRMFSKGAPYEEAVRLPFFIRGPGTRQNATSELLVSSMDIAPTMLEIAGLDPLEYGMDGRSLVAPMFQYDESLIPWRDAFLIEQPEPFPLAPVPWQAMRTSDALYVQYHGGHREYYDLAEDPYQLSNAYTAQDPVTLYEMSSQLSQMRAASGEDLRAAEAPEVTV